LIIFIYDISIHICDKMTLYRTNKEEIFRMTVRFVDKQIKDFFDEHPEIVKSEFFRKAVLNAIVTGSWKEWK